MANITINEVSQNYTYNIGNSSYATVALPITASWGPGFEYDSSTTLILDEERLESSVWTRFPATQAGLEAFAATYRGPATQYLSRKDFSYQEAMTLLTAGYDLLICRIAGGDRASGAFYFADDVDAEEPSLELPIIAKYPGSFGNNIQVALRKISKRSFYDYWNVVVYVVDSAGVRTAVENLNFVFDLEHATDTVLHISEVESNFITFDVSSAPSYDSIQIFAQNWPNDDSDVETSGESEYDKVNKIQLAHLAGGTDHPSLNEEITEQYTEAEQVYEEALAQFEQLAEACRIADQNYRSFNDANQARINELAAKESDGTITEEEQSELDDLRSQLSDLETAKQEATNEYEAARPAFESAKEARNEALAAVSGMSGQYLSTAAACAKSRFSEVGIEDSEYVALLEELAEDNSVDPSDVDDGQYPSPMKVTLKSADQPTAIDSNMATIICQREWMFNGAFSVLGALTDKLAYNPNRVIVPGWDDQDFAFLLGTPGSDMDIDVVSPLHQRLMVVAYYSRCATAYIDVPRSLKRSRVYYDSTTGNPGYAQLLSAVEQANLEINGSLFASHSALFAPWGKYTYVGTGKQLQAAPSFLALMIERAMIKNQTSQYEWELPTNRRHNLKLGKLDYTISKKYLDLWQSTEGVGVNCITAIPDLGVSIWGNSTLYEVPPATYQALANLSTRKLVNAVEDLAYRCGIAITFRYNNQQAYNAFYAGMVPLLDTMQNVGAIQDYYIRMSNDLDQLGQVMANSIVGKIYLVVEGVINNITIDLIALPPQTDLDQFKA